MAYVFFTKDGLKAISTRNTLFDMFLDSNVLYCAKEKDNLFSSMYSKKAQAVPVVFQSGTVRLFAVVTNAL